MAIKEIKWNKWGKGLNTLFAPNKIKPDELSKADNIILIGQGEPFKRWGTDYYGNNDSTLTHTLHSAYYNSNGTDQQVKISNGLFKKFNTGTSNWDVIGGASFASTQRARSAILNNVLYISNGTDALTKYDGTTLTRFTAISKPTNLAVARGGSLISGTNKYSYRITAINDIGETDATSNVTVQVDKNRDEWNFDATSPTSNYSVNLTWTASASATGYNIYGITESTETFLARVDGQASTSWRDYGTKQPSAIIGYPTANTTDAPKGNLISVYKSSLVISGDPSAPSRLYYSAGVDKPEDFSYGAGGGFVDITKNSDDGVITAIKQYQDSLVVFKERSIHKFDFTTSEIPSVVSLNKDVGAISQGGVSNVENDIFFVGKKVGGYPGVFVLGNEPNYLNQIRTNELSARVRTELMGLLYSNYANVESSYIDNRYILAYEDGSNGINNRALVYDREKLGWTKWKDLSMHHVIIYFKSGTQKILYIDKEDNRVSELNSSFDDDKGSPILWSFATREEDMGEPFIYKKIRWVNLNVENTDGTSTMRVYWSGNNYTDFSLSLNNRLQSTAFGSLGFGSGKFGSTENINNTLIIGTIAKRIPLHRLGMSSVTRSVKFEFSGTAIDSKLALLDLFFEFQMRSRSYAPLEEVYQI